MIASNSPDIFVGPRSLISIGKNNKPAHLSRRFTVTGAILPPTGMSFMCLHMPLFLAQEEIYFLYWAKNTNFVTRLQVAQKREGLIGNRVQQRVCDIGKWVVPFLEHLLSLQECNDILRRCFTYLIYTSKIYVPFHVKRPLILSDSNKT